MRYVKSLNVLLGITVVATMVVSGATAYAAGPYDIGPGGIQYDIPTWAFTRTVVHVNAQADGFIQMTAGGSPQETDQVRTGDNAFARGFGGVLLAIKNLTSRNIRVTTE